MTGAKLSTVGNSSSELYLRRAARFFGVTEASSSSVVGGITFFGLLRGDLLELSELDADLAGREILAGERLLGERGLFEGL